MLGGGPGSLIGDAHRDGLYVSGCFDLVAGCFSRDITKSEAIQTRLQKKIRLYADWCELIKTEALRGTQAILIATPDSLHYDQAKAALEQGLHVIVDKPMCKSLDEASTLFTLAKEQKLRLETTYTYRGDPVYEAFADHARPLITKGSFQVSARLVAHWANSYLEKDAQHPMHRQSWRFRRDFGSGALGDIAVHIFEYSRNILPAEPLQLSASLQKTITPREQNDGGIVLLSYPQNSLVCLQFSLALVAADYYCIDVCTAHHAFHYSMGSSTYEYKAEDAEARSFTIEKASDTDFSSAAGEVKDTRTVTSFARLYRDFGAKILAKERYTEEDRAQHPGLCGIRFVDRVLRAAEQKTWIDW